MGTATADPLVGHVLEGRYRITERIARGGMSTVYAATDERLDRRVAVKIMSASLSADPAFVNRFAREARLTAKLSHVNAVSVYDQGSDGHHVFLVMELVRGRTLRDLIRERGHLSPAEAVSVLEPVLAALAAAHRAGLVHRDVKPENILLADDGLVKVADFGLARAVAADTSSTRTGLMMGTVAYSSPEQFRRGGTDARSDVYSAGIVLYELLTGQPPYQGGDAMAIAYRHVHEDVPPPSSVRRGLAGPLDAFVQQATARDPQRRFSDAGAMSAALHDLRRDLHLPVLPVPRRRSDDPARPVGTGAAARAAPAAAPAVVGAGRGGPSTDRTDQLRAVRTAPQPVGPGERHDTLIAEAPAGRTRRTSAAPRAARPRRRRRRWLRALLTCLIVILVCAGAVFAGWYFASGRYRAVPDVRDRPAPEATAILERAGFSVHANEPIFDESVVKGSVVRTDPVAGHRARRGGTIDLIVSNGPRLYAIPELRKQSKAAATAALSELVAGGVSVRYEVRADDEIVSGAVIATEPIAGAQVRSGDSVTVFVSSGPPILTVPDVRTKTVADATAQLKALGFEVSVTRTFSDTAKVGTVISQTPEANGTLRKFETVQLVVSKGPDLVAVPDIKYGDPLDEARTKLEALGFKVVVQKTWGDKYQRVVGVDPPAGTKIKRGSTVTLSII